MQTIGLDSYDFGLKRKWRREVWNEITKRLTVPRGEAIVLYLPGPDDEDGKIALQKGFKRRNLIAVDLNEDNIIRIRKQGGLGICGNLIDVVNAWETPTLDVIVADFCHGYNIESVNLELSIQASNCFTNVEKPGGTRGVIMVNMMRGRETHWKQVLIDHPHIKDKHRGKYFMSSFCFWLSMNFCKTCERSWKGTAIPGEDLFINHLIKRYPPNPCPDDGSEGWFYDSAKENFYTELNPKYLSYKSEKGMMMDTVIFTYPQYFKEGLFFNSSKNNNIARKIAATKAIRTMKYVA
jgi:hypothetical protein